MKKIQYYSIFITILFTITLILWLAEINRSAEYFIEKYNIECFENKIFTSDGDQMRFIK